MIKGLFWYACPPDYEQRRCDVPVTAAGCVEVELFI